MTTTKNTDICSLENVILQENLNSGERKKPKRILQFCDGVREEYSEGEDEPIKTVTASVTDIDPKKLDWMPWAWYQATCASYKMLEGCDYVGEWLADFFGITTPKYQFEINEYYRMKALENEMAKKEDLEMGGWSDKNKNNLLNDGNTSSTNS